MLKHSFQRRLDCPLEYKKGESQTNVEMSKETDFDKMLRIEEDYIERMCAHIIKFKPDVVCTEKGVAGMHSDNVGAGVCCLDLLSLILFFLRLFADLAQHYFVKAGISCLRRLRKMDNDRIARATGATIVNEPEEIKEADIGTGYVRHFCNFTCSAGHVALLGSPWFCL